MSLIEHIQSTSPVLWWYLAAINVVCFAAMGVDKYKAIHNKWRIPEKTLFLLAALGGSLGGIFGIYTFRHKTLHKKFTIGFPSILIVELAAVAYLTGYIG